MQAVDHNGVKVYDMCIGKTLPQWLTEKKKRSIRKDEEYMKRIELIQDFHFNTYSSRIKVSNDGHHIIAAGGYPPQVKVYDTRELSLKFERHIDSPIVQFEVLADDYSKIVFLDSERTLQFHAAYGAHYKLRIPYFGRDLSYDPSNCELFVAACGKDVYRVDLEQGTFLSPFSSTHDEGVNCLGFSPSLQLLACGGSDGDVSCWDSRSGNKQVGVLNLEDEITSLKLDDTGVTMAVGCGNGTCSIYDLRSSRAVCTKEHPSGREVVGLDFQRGSRLVVSADPKSIRFWNRDNGNSFVNIEPQFDVNDICLVHTSTSKTSGLLFAAGETDRIMSFYIPRLGHAPKWACFLDNLTEELEEQKKTDENVYENYKFVTTNDLETLGVSHLLGTPLLRAYMHGYFMDMRLYDQIKADAQPVAFEDWRKQNIRKKIEAKTEGRIIQKPSRVLPKVNSAFVERAAEETKDSRFTAMFEDPDFEIDETSDNFKQIFSSGVKRAEANTKPRKKLVMKEGEEASLIPTDKKRRASTTLKEKLVKKSHDNDVKYLSAGNMELSFSSGKKKKKK